MPADRATGAQKSIEKPLWRATALAIATAVLLGVSATDASALALGRITVQSALGEPLRAEIDIPEINAEELATLRVGVAAPDAFRAAGLDYNAALTGVRITLERRPDGRHFLRLSSQRPVNDPFLDLILETNWSSGRIVRDYTMLFDPPNLRQAPAPLAAQVTPAAPAVRPAAPAAAAPTAPAPATPAARAPAARPATPTAPVRDAASPRPPAAEGGKQVTVRAGETASKIAAAHKPAEISLDQMLVALLRANPDAFIGGNVNRLRAGAVLEVPTAEQAAVDPTDARQTLQVQSRDFNEFRRRLAEALPTQPVGQGDRQASGKVQAQVEDKKPAATAPDKLTLSKGAVQGKGSEDKIARDRAAQDAATRVAELNKNISDLNKLATAPGAAATASAAKPGVTLPTGAVAAASAPKPALPVSPPVMAAASAAPAVAAPAVAAAASAPTLAAPVPATAAETAASAAAASAAAASASAATAAATPASAPADATATAAAPLPAPAKPASAVKRTAPPAETSLVDDLLENPLVPATVGGVLALLLGFGFYRAQQRKKSTQVDSSFLESRLQPDSFFGASGGQRIDTNEGGATGSSMVYSPSQLDAAGDVDPVAEADVYLAYGRDLQAEEILKEAMRTTPQRVAVHGKLLEIYAKRRDAKAFEVVATEAYALTRGEGPDWERICELGQELDASNALYRPGGHPAEGAVAATATAAAAVGSFGSTTAVQALPVAAAPTTDLDLDLDFSLGDDEPAAPAATPAYAAPEPTLALNVPPPMPSLDMDFGSATVALEAPALRPVPAAPELPVAQPEPVRLEAPDLNLHENNLSFDLDLPAAPAPVAAAPAPAAAPDAGMIEFDLGALSLDLGGPAAADKSVSESDTDDAPLSTAGAPLSTTGFDDTGSGDPLATKLALAQEFNSIGDPDGARSLAQEVVAEASGELKSQAQRFLAEIG
ncbi:MAG TPA: FimV/HubP family polar landmark protein [Ramlibacter sp.]|nr:FimV/HubP family polar landmark protein [Ramlibacter sp.]